jgi:hypothetical protein
VTIGRGDVHTGRTQWHFGHNLERWEVTRSLQDLVQNPWRAGRDVLHNADRRGKLAWQCADKHPQRIDAARGGANNNDSLYSHVCPDETRFIPPPLDSPFSEVTATR